MGTSGRSNDLTPGICVGEATAIRGMLEGTVLIGTVPAKILATKATSLTLAWHLQSSFMHTTMENTTYELHLSTNFYQQSRTKLPGMANSNSQQRELLSQGSLQSHCSSSDDGRKSGPDAPPESLRSVSDQQSRPHQVMKTVSSTYHSSSKTFLPIAVITSYVLNT